MCMSGFSKCREVSEKRKLYQLDVMLRFIFLSKMIGEPVVLQFLAQDDGLDFNALETAAGLQGMVLRGRLVDSVDSRPVDTYRPRLSVGLTQCVMTATRHRRTRNFPTLQLH